MGNALKTLLQKRHIHAYSAFVSEYQRHAAGKSRGVVEFREPGVTVPGVSLPGLGWAIA